MKYLGSIKSVCLCAILSLSACFLSNSGELKVINNSSDSIKIINIDICGQRMLFADFGRSETRSGHYRVTNDCSYKVEVDFENGKKLSKQGGYVTHGFDYSDSIIIEDDSIIIKTRNS